MEVERERHEYATSHPMFGEPGEIAPMNNREFAELMHNERPDLFPGKSPSALSLLRRKCGIKPNGMNRYEITGETARYQLNAEDKKIQKLCKLTHGWSRPKGMDAHLEALNER